MYHVKAQEKSILESKVSNTAKPWTRWWWMGSAVDKKNIESSLVSFAEAGLGGVEITPIYGVRGETKNDVPYLSRKWLDLLDYTIKTADSLGLQVDVTLGTGWPYGGPQVAVEHAATKLIVDTLLVGKGKRFTSKIVPDDPKDRFSAELAYVLAFGKDGGFLDLTPKLSDNFLNWKAKKEDYTLFKVFTGKTGQQVKRAAPGGEGYTVDHYSESALDRYLTRFDSAFTKHGTGLRAIFNDSYEVYETDFTPAFFEQFKNRRGYDLKPYLRQLLSKSDEEIGNRIKSDYRETLSDLLLTQFDEPWTAWGHDHGFKTRLQAHGSPGNLLDLYASADIPECETFGSMAYDINGFRREREDIREGDADPIMLKFSTSAAHVSGKPLASSETFTWLRDHFKTALSQCKPEAEDLMLNGVNHIFLHGSTYSPERALWPGWKFYASVNFSRNNTIWEDAPALFSYIANCQLLLQSGKPDNEILLYWPIYDVWDDYLDGNLFFQFKIHSLGQWLHHIPFYETAVRLTKGGYGSDFISDRFIAELSVENGMLVSPGGTYKSLVVPPVEHMPLVTLAKLIDLKNDGASIIFQGLPNTVPGFHRFAERTEELNKMISLNQKKLNVTTSLENSLKMAQIIPESLVTYGLKYIRRDLNGKKTYYLVNHTAKDIDTYIPLRSISEQIQIYDPMTSESGIARTKVKEGKTYVRVNIPSGRSLFLISGSVSNSSTWKYYKEGGVAYPIEGNWNLKFIKGGPALPPSIELDTLRSWTELGDKEAAFSGTAQYEINVQNPNEDQEYWKLNLGDVRESAKVWLNGSYVGTVWANPFELNIGKLKTGMNTLSIEVTNLPANRIRAKELRGEEWKIFKEINMVNKDYKPFDATVWKPMPSGLLNNVTLTPLILSTDD